MSCNACTRDCPVRDSVFLDRLEETLRGIQQGFMLPEVLVQHSIRQGDGRYVRMAEVYTCFRDGDFDKVDYNFKTGKGYVCDILRAAFNVWKWDKGLEKTQWDREYFSRKENREKDRELVEKYFKGR